MYFLMSWKCFSNHVDAFETSKISVSPRREPYFSKIRFLMFSLFRAVLGLSWGPCWPHFRSLGAVLEASWAILGLARAGQARSGQVRSAQGRSRWTWALPRLWGEARSGQEGVPRSYKDGSPPKSRFADTQSGVDGRKFSVRKFFG